VERIITEERKALKIQARRILDTEIVDRLLYALVNEGAQILEEGIAQRASDIDLVYLAGYGFPAQRGGPMFHASRIGLAVVARRMKEFGWKPARLVARLAAEGKSFDDALPAKKRIRRG
jgi:3-hydroxyacyl-CoA dehydrogenase